MDNYIAYCGVDCSVCCDLKEGKCPGCRQTVWKKDDICMPVKCCREKNISCCGECTFFACEDMKDFYNESESHKKAYELMHLIK